MVRMNITTLVAFSTIIGQAASAMAAPAGGGIASNRMALALPLQEGSSPCRPVSGNPDSCIPLETAGAYTGTNLTVPLLLGGVAAAGIGVVVATSGGKHSPVSP